MVDGLDRLRHDIVVGGDDDDCKVGHFRSTGTHGGEGLVAGGVEEGDSPSVGELDVVGSDMLGDAACLSRYDVGFTDIVEQRGLAMVDVAHYGHDRRTRDEILVVVLLRGYGLCDGSADVFGCEAEFLGHDVDGLGVEALIDRHHDPEVHTRCNDVVDGDFHKVCEVVGRHELGQLYHAAFSLLAALVLKLTVVDGLFLLLAPFDALLGSLVGEPGKSFLDLLLHVFGIRFLLRGAVVVPARFRVAFPAVATFAFVLRTLLSLSLLPFVSAFLAAFGAESGL